MEGVEEGGGGEGSEGRGGDEGWWMRGEAVRELVGRGKEVVKSWTRLTEDLGLGLEEPGLVEGGRTEDQSLLTWRRGREKHLGEDFCSGNS